MKKTINIVAIKDNWILQKIVEHLVDRIPYIEWTETPTKKQRITYFVNYAQVVPQKVSEIEMALFTHIEDGVEEKVKKWKESSQKVDVAVCMSKMYKKKIVGGRYKAVVIPPGVDLTRFKQKPIIVGVVGRTAKSNRKGEELISRVNGIPGIEWRFTGQGWPGRSTMVKDSEMPSFYAGLDYLLVAGTIEGGPMPAIEALASGVPVISSRVGWMPELPHIEFKKGDAESLGMVLSNLVQDRSKLRQSVENRSWDNFATKHDVLFRQLLSLPKGSVGYRQIKGIINKINREN